MLKNHSHFSLIELYLEQEPQFEWVCATVVNKEGSSYRSPGAMMMINSIGQTYGLVSGGCLEANLTLHAKKVFDSKKSLYIEYDMREEDSYALELGVGCKGKIGILLQFLSSAHQAVISCLYERLKSGQTSYLQHDYLARHLKVQTDDSLVLYDELGTMIRSTAPFEHLVSQEASFRKFVSSFRHNSKQHINIIETDKECSITRLSAPFNVWVFGGGADAISLVNMANQLGWRVTLVDHRSSYARKTLFKSAANILHIHPDDFFLASNEIQIKQFAQLDAAILMTHNLTLDAMWLKHLYQYQQAQYIGLLGPSERRINVEKMTKIGDNSWLKENINGPVGLNLGGELPESIALSIISQCHAQLHNADGLALNNT